MPIQWGAEHDLGRVDLLQVEADGVGHDLEPVEVGCHPGEVEVLDLVVAGRAGDGEQIILVIDPVGDLQLLESPDPAVAAPLAVE